MRCWNSLAASIEFIPFSMKSALFVAGGWDGHEPKSTAGILAGCLQTEGFRTEVIESLDVFLDSEKLRRFHPDCAGLDDGNDYE